MLACVLWLGVGRAPAQDSVPSTVLVVRVPGDDNIVVRLRAELSSYRFRVIELPPAKRAEKLSQLAEERDAQAALRAKPDSMAVEVWVRASGAGARTSEELVNAGPGRSPQVLAVRVTEAMRARGLALPPLIAAAPRPAGVPAADSGKRRRPAPDNYEVPPPTAAPPEATDVEPARPTAPAPVAPARPTAKNAAAPAPPQPTAATLDPKQTEPSKPGPKQAEPSRTPELKQAETSRTPSRALEPKQAAPSRTPDPKQAERPPEPKKPLEIAKAPASPETARAEPANDPTRSEPEPDTNSARATPIRPRAALVYAEVGPTGVWSPGENHVGPALDVMVSVKFRPNQASSVSLVGLIPLLSEDLTTNDGAQIEVQTFGIGGFGDLHLPIGRVELHAGVGGMALFSSILPDAVYESDYPLERLAALLGRVGASFALTRDLRVSGSLMIGLTVNELRLQFPRTPGSDVETPDAVWGRPLLFFGTLGLELALPWDRPEH